MRCRSQMLSVTVALPVSSLHWVKNTTSGAAGVVATSSMKG